MRWEYKFRKRNIKSLNKKWKRQKKEIDEKHKINREIEINFKNSSEQ